MFEKLQERLSGVFDRLTKRGALSELLAWATERTPRGEFVIVVAGSADRWTEDE